MTGPGAEAGARLVVGFVPDLMDRSRILEAAAQAGVAFELVSSVDALIDRAPHAAAIIVDLGRPVIRTRLAELRAITSARIVGFGAHVDNELLADAEASGCDVALPRSRFFRDPFGGLQP